MGSIVRPPSHVQDELVLVLFEYQEAKGQHGKTARPADDHHVQAEQLATIDKGDVISVIDHLTDADVARVDKAIIASLGLEVSA